MIEKLHVLKINNRTKQLLESLRGSMFLLVKGIDENPMPLENFIHALCCAVIFNRKKGR